MKSVFADTGYWIALLNRRDDLHAKAQSVSSELGLVRMITSEMVLTEVLNSFAKGGYNLRQAAAFLVEELRKDQNTTVVSQSSIQFGKALSLYRQYEDKEWGLTDCASILIMQEQDIKEALAYDKCFKQAGFVPLLRDED